MSKSSKASVINDLQESLDLIRDGVKAVKKALPIDMEDLEGTNARHNENMTIIAKAYAEAVVLYEKYTIVINREKARIQLEKSQLHPKPSDTTIQAVYRTDQVVMELQDEQLEVLRDKIYLDVQVENYQNRSRHVRDLYAGGQEREGRKYT